MKRLNLDSFLVWAIVFTFTLYLSLIILKSLNIADSFFYYIGMGLLIAVVSRIVRIFIRNRQFTLTSWFFLLVVLNGLTVWIWSYLFVKDSIPLIISYIIGGLLLSLVYKTSASIKFFHSNTILSTLVLLLLLFFGISGIDVSSSGFTPTLLSGNKLDFGFLFGSSCPQINVSLTRGQGALPFMDVREYDGWKISPYDAKSMLGFSSGKIYCHQGNKQGQNPNFVYCGDQTSSLMQKTLVNEDGTIGKTIRQSFVNIYEMKIDEDLKYLCDNTNTKTMQQVSVDSNGKDVVEILECGRDEYVYIFQKTICGDDPDKLAAAEAKQIIDEMDSLFN